MTRGGRGVEGGFGLVGAMAGITIMLTLMAVAMPAWKYVTQDDKEEELIFRGSQIADAITRYQRESRSLPVNLEILVQKKFLRKAYKDPMSKSGRWRFIHPGEPIPALVPGGRGANPMGGKGGEYGGGLGGGLGGRSGGRGREENPGKTATFVEGMSMGPILGVASTSKAKGLRLFNGRSRYNEWIFIVGMPRIVGKMPLVIPGGNPPGGIGKPPVGGAPKR